MKPGSYRLFILFLAFIGVIALVSERLFELQILKHSYYKAIASRIQKSTRQIPARRGTIFDRHLCPLAMTLPAYLVWADPHCVKEPWQTAQKVAQVLDLNANHIAGMLADKKSRYQVLHRAVGLSEASRIIALDLEGVLCEPIGRRMRPMDDLARNVIGTVSIDGEGLNGLEWRFEDVLRGKPGKRVYLKDAHGKIRPSIGSVVEEPLAGKSVVLTIDAEIQHEAEKALEEAIAIHKAKAGGVVVVNPRTGDIVAMASVPRDPNYPVQVAFEPGSSLKFCTYASALELGKVSREEVFCVEGGKLKVAGGFVRDDHPHDVMTLNEAFAYSSNVVAAVIATRVGASAFYRYLSSFGFGRRTGIELDGEATGLLEELEDWSARSLQTIAFGQEIGVTAIQMAMALSAIANGGDLLRPRLVKAIIDDRGETVRQFPTRVVRKVISRQTAQEVTNLMRAVVEQGTGVPASIAGFAVAGKTGTGQKAECGRYVKGKGYALFVGFVPAQSPKYACVVVIEDPSAWTSYGGLVAGPVFKSIMEYALRRDRDTFPAGSVQFARLDLDGSDIATPPGAACSFDLASTLTPGRQQSYPSVVGLTLREAATVLARCGIRWRAAGSGLVVRQDPSPGEPIDRSPICTLRMGGAP